MDPKPRIEKECHKPCTGAWREYEKCKDRIKAAGEGSCEPWAFDYWKCIDACVSGRRPAAPAGRRACSGPAGACARAPARGAGVAPPPLRERARIRGRATHPPL